MAIPPPQGHMSFTTAYGGLSNVIQTDVHIAQAFDPVKTAKHPEHLKFQGIWDTGATGSVITKNVVDALSLKPIGMTQVHTAGGVTSCEVYLINMILPNRVGLPGLRVTQATIHDGCDVLIGMDVIGRGDFAITNHLGKTTCSFRLPSKEKIDFVKQKHRPVKNHGKVGRNDPCPCGSGRKYKKCCGS